MDTPDPTRTRSNPGQGKYQFGAFEACTQTGELRKHGIPIQIPHQSFQLLVELLKKAGEVVSREELQEVLWPGMRFGDPEHGLNRIMNRLREALGDNPEEPRYIQTLPRKGYRFISPVTPTKRDEPRKALRRRWPLWVAGGSLAGAVAALLGWWVAAPVKITSLAVLPMANLSPNAEEEYLADGMTEAVIASLAQVRSLDKVISRTSVMQFKGTKTPAPEIARKLGVKGIVEGTVQRHGERVRVTVQLIDAVRDRHIWSRSYDRDLRDVLILQNEIARAVAEEVQAALGPEERLRLTATRKVNPEAYKFYARGRRLCGLWTVEGFQKSFPLFEEAISLDPEFAEAHGAYAECLLYLVTWGAERPGLVWPRIREHAQKAIEIRPDDPGALAVLGMVRLQGDWDWAGAGRHLDRVVEVAPGSGFARMMRSVYLTAMGKFGEALDDAGKAEALDPGSTLAASFLPWVNAKARRFDEAAQGWNRLLGMDPHAYFAKSQIIFALTRLGRSSEAVQFYEELRQGMPTGTDQLVDSWVMEYEIARGMKANAARSTELWMSGREKAYVDAFHLAWMNSVLGRRDEAMKWLEAAYAERSAEMYVVKVDPTLDALRGDPRFEALVKRMKFPE